MKRLALFFDGTWNLPGSDTNVWRLSRMLADRNNDGVRQLIHYDPGVGTKWYDRLSGGAFGQGLSRNVLDGYRWLVAHYDPGDQIYLFGFSRGAVTARSLAGVIARCGLLERDAPLSSPQVYDRYRKGDDVRPLYELLYLRDRKGETRFDSEELALLAHSRWSSNLVEMVGVWDTVGSIGVPFGNIPGVSRSTLQFHNTHLSTIVRHSYQALALDEFRKPFWAILWTRFAPDQPTPSIPRDDERIVEQRWFSGAHSNVGGGYARDLLPRRPLAWILSKAESCGLAFRERVRIEREQDLHRPIRDSYGEFLGGAWKVLTLGRRYVRWVMSDPVRKEAHQSGLRAVPAGTVTTVNERIDLSVFRRCQMDPTYRPLSLEEWARRRKLDLNEVIADPESHSFCQEVSRTGIEAPQPEVLTPA